MPYVNPVIFYKGSLPTIDTTLYNTGDGAIRTINGIVVTNSGPQVANFSLSVDGVTLHSSATIQPGETFYAPVMRLSFRTEISGHSSTDYVTIHISGSETVL